MSRFCLLLLLLLGGGLYAIGVTPATVMRGVDDATSLAASQAPDTTDDWAS